MLWTEIEGRNCMVTPRLESWNFDLNSIMYYITGKKLNLNLHVMDLASHAVLYTAVLMYRPRQHTQSLIFCWKSHKHLSIATCVFSPHSTFQILYPASMHHWGLGCCHPSLQTQTVGGAPFHIPHRRQHVLTSLVAETLLVGSPVYSSATVGQVTIRVRDAMAWIILLL